MDIQNYIYTIGIVLTFVIGVANLIILLRNNKKKMCSLMPSLHPG